MIDWIEPLLMQDGARCHWSRFTRAELERWQIECTDHPPYSPDLNPIENVWNWIREYISQRYGEQDISLDRLKPVVEDAWQEVPEYMLENLSWKSGEIYYSDMGLVQIQPTFPMCLYVLCG
jgi:hypothetical protein